MTTIDEKSSALSKWIAIKDEEYTRNNPPDFVTHLNYVAFLKDISQNLSLNTSLDINSSMRLPEIVKKKINLIKLTRKSIAFEYKAVQENPEFAQVCVSWISVKSYYLLFNMLIILRYLITKDMTAFADSHMGLIKWLNVSIDNKTLVFNKDEFNTVYDGAKIHEWKSTTGANIKRTGLNREERFLQILKKIQAYKEEDYMRRNKILNLRKKVNKIRLNEYRTKNKVSVLEFFYWYRIKANYRDLEFLDKEIAIGQFKDYYCNYYELSNNVYASLKSLINELCKKRGIQALELL
jgi:hypothetical protein